ncbi:hypothetical protein [Luteimonas sp. SDU82]|uniref:hypothetical protein n=1 Tax=Luteimonas sp. SDU82 TaxID=3422592 RepID=UPI003EB83502
MAVQWATVVAGTETPAGDGSTGAMRCILKLPDHSLVAGFLKKDPVEMVFAEVLAAILLKDWGLPVPSPYLVRDGSDVWFASADVGYPNLKKRMAIDSLPPGNPAYPAAIACAVQMALTLPSAPLAAVIDEAIDNRDRNLGNILWDGSEEVWIDHAHAFGLGASAGFVDVNKLCAMAVNSGDHAKFMEAVIQQWPDIGVAAVQAGQEHVAELHDVEAWCDLVSTRLATIGMRLVNRFPPPDDLLAGIQ